MCKFVKYCVYLKTFVAIIPSVFCISFKDEHNCRNKNDPDCINYAGRSNIETDSLGLEWITLSHSSNELESVEDIYSKYKQNHPGLIAASHSANLRRSTKQVFILLLGLTGSGKSATINYLFQTNIAKTNDQRSETKSTSEYYLSMQSSKYRIKDLTLSLIDTPGFGDTEGLEQDAKNIASIKNFLKNHIYLKNGFPNLIYLVVKSDDNRMLGSNSQLSKMLKELTYLKAIDTKKINLMVILTHACALSPIKWKERVERKIDEVKFIVKSHLEFVPKVAIIETDYESCELEYNDGWHILPDGRKQPKQIYDSSKRLLQASGDILGREAIQLFATSRSKSNVATGLVVSPEESELDGLDEILSILTQDVTIADTMVSRMFHKYYEKRKTMEIYKDILILKSRFQDLNLKEENDVKQFTGQQMKLLLQPTRLTFQMEKIISDLFAIQFS